MDKYENILEIIKFQLNTSLQEGDYRHSYFYTLTQDIFGDRLAHSVNKFSGVCNSSFLQELSGNAFAVCYGVFNEISIYPYIPEELENIDLKGYNGLISVLYMREQSIGRTFYNIVSWLKLFFELCNEIRLLNSEVEPNMSSNYVKKHFGNYIWKINNLLSKINSIHLEESLKEEVLPKNIFVNLWNIHLSKNISGKFLYYLNDTSNLFDNFVFSNKTKIKILRDNVKQYISQKDIQNISDELFNDIKIIISLPIVCYSVVLSNFVLFIKEYISSQEFLKKFNLSSDFSEKEIKNPDLLKRISKFLGEDPDFKKVLGEYMSSRKIMLSIENPIVTIYKTKFYRNNIIKIFDSLSAI